MQNDNAATESRNNFNGTDYLEIARHCDFNVGSAIKHLWNARRNLALAFPKDTVENLRQAIFYLNDEIKRLGGSVENPAPPVCQEPAKAEAADGLYLILKGGAAIPFDPENKPKPDDNYIAVGLKMGSKRIAVALHDFQDGDGNKDITLTTQKSEKDYGGYQDNYLDAGADWDGKGNTEHLKQTGLNAAIKLEPDQWIPSLAELKFVQLFRKEVNEALEFAGGDKLDSCWYWSSTEYSATYAWYLGLSVGTATSYAKATAQGRVRPVSAFLPLNL